jgi:hypothetical protein
MLTEDGAFTDSQTPRQHGDFISLLLFFKHMQNRLKRLRRSGLSVGLIKEHDMKIHWETDVYMHHS